MRRTLPTAVSATLRRARLHVVDDDLQHGLWVRAGVAGTVTVSAHGGPPGSAPRLAGAAAAELSAAGYVVAISPRDPSVVYVENSRW